VIDTSSPCPPSPAGEGGNTKVGGVPYPSPYFPQEWGIKGVDKYFFSILTEMISEFLRGPYL